MALLIIGILLWSGIHLIPALAQPLKQAWQARLGENGYKATFALLIALSLVLIVFGWRSIAPVQVYSMPGFTRFITIVLMLVVFILFGASHAPSRIKQYIRHPQLTAMMIWSIAHLLANGDDRSLVLFGGLGLWAIIEMAANNHRDGAWLKPDIPPLPAEIRGVIISVIIFIAAVFLHPYFAGVALV